MARRGACVERKVGRKVSSGQQNIVMASGTRICVSGTRFERDCGADCVHDRLNFADLDLKAFQKELSVRRFVQPVADRFNPSWRTC